MPKVGRTALLRLELAEAEASESFVGAKAKRKTCDGCGRTETTAKIEADVDQKRTALRDARRKYREARDG